MKNGSLLSAAAVLLIACNDGTKSPAAPGHQPPDVAFATTTGNGAPSGAHYTLNIIGVEKGHTADNSNSSGRRIFVPLGRSGTAACDINLTQGDFAVLDYNCLDSDKNADFQLPNPDNGSGSLAYSVWVRALGKPGGSATMRTCFTEFETNTQWCNAGDLVVNLSRGSGSSKFVDVSKKLLQVCADTDPTDAINLQLVPLFSDLGTGYLWRYENTGLRLAQLRFYAISGGAIGGTCTRTTG